MFQRAAQLGASHAILLRYPEDSDVSNINAHVRTDVGLREYRDLFERPDNVDDSPDYRLFQNETEFSSALLGIKTISVKVLQNHQQLDNLSWTNVGNLIMQYRSSGSCADKKVSSTNDNVAL